VVCKSIYTCVIPDDGPPNHVASLINTFVMCRDSSVGIANRYWLDGSGIESRWGRDFPHPSRPALGPTQPTLQWVTGLSRGVRRPGRGVDHPPPSSTKVKEKVVLYLYSLFGPSWPVRGRTLLYYSILFSHFIRVLLNYVWCWTLLSPFMSRDSHCLT
jgi:hypothetical protein